MRLRNACFAIILTASFVPSVLAQCGEHSDVLIGRTAAGQLVIGDAEFSLGDSVLLCPVDGILDGFTNGNPGFDAEEVIDDPENDFLKLEPGAIISIEVISIDPAFKAWGPGLATLIDESGEQITLGSDNLHEHLTWHADSNDPDFNPSATEWLATFKFVDSGSTGYTESAPFEMRFTNQEAGEAIVPTVSEWGMLAMAFGMLGGAILLSRRGSALAPCAL